MFEKIYHCAEVDFDLVYLRGYCTIVQRIFADLTSVKIRGTEGNGNSFQQNFEWLGEKLLLAIITRKNLM